MTDSAVAFFPGGLNSHHPGSSPNWGIMAMTEEQQLIIELGFAIEDPLGRDAILLARALVRFARRVPEANRRAVAELLESATADEIAQEFKRKANHAQTPN